METTEILMQAKLKEGAPQGWVIFPLQRGKVVSGIAGWVFGTCVGFGLFTIVAFAVIPYNYQRGAAPAIFTTLFLGILLFIGFGSIFSLIVDVIRLSRATEHIIVITTEDFVKQEGAKVIHVPLRYVRNVTARGKQPLDRTPPNEAPNMSENVTGLIFGRGLNAAGLRHRRKRMRTPTSLAFIDARTDSEVTVVFDEAHGDPFYIGAVIKQYAASVQNIA